MKYIALLSFIFLISCQQSQETQLPESKVLAVVGESAVTEDMFKAFLKANGVVNPSEEIAARALDQLIDEVAMANIAIKKELKLSAEQLNALNYLKIRAHSQNAQLDYVKANPISDEEIKAEYEGASAVTGGFEYKIHHMQFVDEVQAINVLEQITSGDDYLLQQAAYLETTTFKNVGELGWVNLKQLPESFAQSMLVAEKDQVLKDVVKSQFGAHVVYVEDIRPLTPPAFEDVKEGIISSLKAKKASKFKQLARAKSKVMLRNK
jgi:peptidyl-prolyl cis-trans isomerase C